MIDREKIVEEARRWIGTPYVNQGRTLGVGADCAFIVAVAASLGLEARDVVGYSGVPGDVDMAALVGSCCDEIPIEEAEPGDVLLFAYPYQGAAHDSHLALLTEPGRMLHAWAVGRRVMEHAITKGWREKLRRAYRMREAI